MQRLAFLLLLAPAALVRSSFLSDLEDLKLGNLTKHGKPYYTPPPTPAPSCITCPMPPMPPPLPKNCAAPKVVLDFEQSPYLGTSKSAPKGVPQPGMGKKEPIQPKCDWKDEKFFYDHVILSTAGYFGTTSLFLVNKDYEWETDITNVAFTHNNTNLAAIKKKPQEGIPPSLISNGNAGMGPLFDFRTPVKIFSVLVGSPHKSEKKITIKTTGDTPDCNQEVEVDGTHPKTITFSECVTSVFTVEGPTDCDTITVDDLEACLAQIPSLP